jgi:broad specificity polyphosphatase/5'/3'-nucleotidase SurE
VGLGGGMMKGVESLAMSFMSKKPFDVKTGRRLVVQCVREYLKNINDCEELTPYLINVPFTAKNLDVVLFSPTEIDNQVDIYYIACHKGFLNYEMEKDETKCSVTVLEETYEEALKIVEEEE